MQNDGAGSFCVFYELSISKITGSFLCMAADVQEGFGGIDA